MQSYSGGLRARQRHDVELNTFRLVEAIGLDGIEQPADRAILQNADLDLVRRLCSMQDGKARYSEEHKS